MKTVVYSSPFVPPEWIVAHGWHPKRALSLPTTGALPATAPSGVCPFALAFSEHVCRRGEEQPDAVIVATTCDQMRRTGDLLAATGNLPVFVFDVPATWQGSAPRRYYESELRRLGAFLVRLGGRRLTDEDIHSLINASAAAAERRRASVTTHSNAPCLEDSSCGSEAALSSGQGRSGLSRCRVPVAIAGGPLGASERLLVNMIDSAGGRVALDATESGERTLPVFSRLRKAEERPETILADAYFGSIPDIFARPDSRFHDWMERMTRERGIRGVIVFVHLWCDRWRAEVQTLRDRLPLPVLLVSSGNELASEHVWARIEAFLEVVR